MSPGAACRRYFTLVGARARGMGRQGGRMEGRRTIEGDGAGGVGAAGGVGGDDAVDAGVGREGIVDDEGVEEGPFCDHLQRKMNGW